MGIFETGSTRVTLLGEYMRLLFSHLPRPVPVEVGKTFGLNELVYFGGSCGGKYLLHDRVRHGLAGGAQMRLVAA